MHLVIGPHGAGKKDFLFSQLGFIPEQIAFSLEDAEQKPVLADLHLQVRRLLEQGKDPDKAVAALLDRRTDLVILCDEVGGGIVPMEPLERRYRDTVGRICCTIARRAERVDRILVGLPMRLK